MPVWLDVGRVGIGRSRFIRGWEGVCKEVIPIIPFIYFIFLAKRQFQDSDIVEGPPSSTEHERLR